MQYIFELRAVSWLCLKCDPAPESRLISSDHLSLNNIYNQAIQTFPILDAPLPAGLSPNIEDTQHEILKR
jgi:hypothetical protein